MSKLPDVNSRNTKSGNSIDNKLAGIVVKHFRRMQLFWPFTAFNPYSNSSKDHFNKVSSIIYNIFYSWLWKKCFCYMCISNNYFFQFRPVLPSDLCGWFLEWIIFWTLEWTTKYLLGQLASSTLGEWTKQMITASTKGTFNILSETFPK